VFVPFLIVLLDFLLLFLLSRVPQPELASGGRDWQGLAQITLVSSRAMVLAGPPILAMKQARGKLCSIQRYVVLKRKIIKHLLDSHATSWGRTSAPAAPVSAAQHHHVEVFWQDFAQLLP
jgi:hypothetical protein